MAMSETLRVAQPVLRLRNQVNTEAVEAPGSQGTPKRSVPKVGT